MARSTTRTRVATMLFAAVLAFAIAGCDPAGPDPTPTTEPTTAPTTESATSKDPSAEPSLSYKEQQITGAEAFIEAYYAEVSTVGNDGYEDWHDRLQPYFGGDPDLWIDDVSVGWAALADRGGHTAGAIEVSGLRTTDWQEDPTESGFDVVSFDVCLDPSTLVNLDGNGHELDTQPQNASYLAAVTVMGQPEAAYGWSFTDYSEDLESTC